ncbi:MAG: hypothetical protein ACK4PI_09975 [Tepidisphaerales bacterium]
MNLKMGVVGMVTSALLVGSAQATILTFDDPQARSNAVQPGYGSRVATATDNGYLYDLTFGPTPNIETVFNLPAFLWPSAYGDLSIVAYGGNGSITITFTADPGWLVALHYFDMAGWPRVDYTIPRVAVEDATTNTVLFEALNPLIRGATVDPITGLQRTRFNFPTPLTATSMRVLFVGGTQNVAIDNIAFSQVPEPAAVGLLAPAGALLLRRRK